MSHTITRLFDNFTDAEQAVVELERLGVPHSAISLVSSNSDGKHAGVKVRKPHDHTAGDAAAGAAAGGLIGAAGGVLAGLGLLAIPGLGPVVAAGWLASAATGAIAGGAVLGAAGGLVGALTNAGVSKGEANVYAEGVLRGGALVAAKVDNSQLASAESALGVFHHVDIIARGAAYREAGWRSFDDSVAERTRSLG